MSFLFFLRTMKESSLRVLAPSNPKYIFITFSLLFFLPRFFQNRIRYYACVYGLYRSKFRCLFLDLFMGVHSEGISFWRDLEIPTYVYPWKRVSEEHVLWSPRDEKYYPNLAAFDKEHAIDWELLGVMRKACEDEMRRLGEIA